MQSAVLLAALLLPGFSVLAQAPPSLLQPSAPSAPADPFPPVNLKNFTADTPTTQTVDSFLKALWGYDQNRIWKIAAIQKTPTPGVSRVVALVAGRAAGSQAQAVVFFVMPDGKHAIADGMIPFGAQPYADMRKLLQDRADGPARGAADKSLMLVEFADLQCAKCKEVQATMDDLVKDFPKARVVFQDMPLVDSHPAAFAAAAYGVCVAKQSDTAFFTYIQAVYDSQDTLTATGTVQTLNNAVTKAGLDPAAISSCAATQATKEAVNAEIKVGVDAGIDQAPLLVVNGRVIPLNSTVPYETLKNIVLHQAELDGIQVPVPPPHMTTLGKQ